MSCNRTDYALHYPSGCCVGGCVKHDESVGRTKTFNESLPALKAFLGVDSVAEAVTKSIEKIQSLTKQVEELTECEMEQRKAVGIYRSNSITWKRERDALQARNEELQSQLKLTSNVPYREAYQRGANYRGREVEQEQVRQLDNLKELLSAIKIDDRGLFSDIPTDKWMDKRKELLK